jgi:hypothetical protein
VANASPLIFLSRIDGLGWLPDLGTGTVAVPRAVVREIEAGADGRVIRASSGPRRRALRFQSAPGPKTG